MSGKIRTKNRVLSLLQPAPSCGASSERKVIGGSPLPTFPRAPLSSPPLHPQLGHPFSDPSILGLTPAPPGGDSGSDQMPGGPGPRSAHSWRSAWLRGGGVREQRVRHELRVLEALNAGGRGQAGRCGEQLLGDSGRGPSSLS